MKLPKFLIADSESGSSRSIRRLLTVVAALMVLSAAILLFMLLQATNNRDLYERNYSVLFVSNVVVAAVLLAAILWVSYRLWMRLKEGKFGSRLLLKLATIFALVGFAPGLLIYFVSYQFVSRSIESWFDVKVEGALQAGLNLGRVTLDTLATDLTTKTRAVAIQVGSSSEALMSIQLEKVEEQLGASQIRIWDANGNLIVSAGESGLTLNPDKPSATQFKAARSARYTSWIEGLEDTTADSAGAAARIKVLALVTKSTLGLTPEVQFLEVTRDLPAVLVANALSVESANREYQERALAREGLRRMYIGTLTLSLFLAVFGAILMAIVLGNQIAQPLLLLAEGVSQVAAGDLRPKLALQGKDELDGLTRAFAIMTRQLADARLAVENSIEQVNASRARVQTILDNITAGVIVLGEGGEIRLANPGASRILGVELNYTDKVKLVEVEGLESFGKWVSQQFRTFDDHREEQSLDHWQQSFELRNEALTARKDPYEKIVTLVARGAHLPDAAFLLVFDDITDIVSAQRAQAWGEVARRLAHEIKNPLTPIQLSAERLEMKLDGKLEIPDQAILKKSIKTIVDQVSAMQRLVNEFRDYARLPSAELKPVDINLLVHDVVQLYDLEHPSCPIKLDVDENCPPVLGDAQQLRQIIHNLLQNAQDATEQASKETETAPSPIVIRTQSQEAQGRVRLSVLDRGTGFPESMLKRAFEPYVTTKIKGTGLGLAVVKKIADEHGARVDVSNRTQDSKVVGAQVSLSLPVYKTATSPT